MEKLHQRLRRLIGFVDHLKNHRHPTAASYAAELQHRDQHENTGLAVSARTIKRDIAWLRESLRCPVEYDASVGGYVLTDPSWIFPLQAIGGPAFPYLPGDQAVRSLVGCREGMYAPAILAERSSVDVQDLIPLISISQGTPPPEPAIIEAVAYGWRDCNVVRITYAACSRQPTVRMVEPHRLFSNEGIWYIRAWCRLREAPRTFALHRVTAAERLEIVFTPRDAIADETRHGNMLGLEQVENAVVRATAESAGFYAEREWFAGQYDRICPDGSLHMLFPRAPLPILLGWILYNAPDLTLIEPAHLRAELYERARKVQERHAT